jgi:hypothetical protein
VTSPTPSSKPGVPENELTTPCGHARPQDASQLHGVCIFCWRNRAAALRARVLTLEKLLRRYASPLGISGACLCDNCRELQAALSPNLDEGRKEEER